MQRLILHDEAYRQPESRKEILVAKNLLCAFGKRA
jgi:hypothetical protein